MLSAPPLRPGYDYIIVGAGSGGCVVARRLIARTDASVLLIEAGEPGLADPSILDPTRWVGLTRGRFDWGYDYAPSPLTDNRRIGIPRGKVLGGSSAINAMMWYRGHPSDYDAWEAAGAEGWGFEACLPYFKRAEDWQDGETAYRGAGGPLRIERSPDPHPLALALIEAAEECGIPVIDDPNGPANEGAVLANFNIAGGCRWSAARGYLEPILVKPRLTVLTGSLAVGIVIDKERAVGVTHLVDGMPVTTRASREVILAAGAIDTPRLLWLSGIGDPLDLRRLDIPVRVPLPGVGMNLQDHPLVRACNFRSKAPMGPMRGNGGGSMINWRSRAELHAPDLHVFPVQGMSAVPEIAASHDLSGDIFALAPGLMRSKSAGYLRLLGRDPGAPMEIQPNFLAEPADLKALIAGIELTMELVATRAIAPFMAGYAAPARPPSAAEAEAFVRNACTTFYHTCGTCRMGEDSEAVVDSRLRVHGVDGLRIADASVIPIIPSCNTHAPVTMIGERAADFIVKKA